MGWTMRNPSISANEVEHGGPADVEQVVPEPNKGHGEKHDADLGGKAQPFLLLEAQGGGHDGATRCLFALFARRSVA